jgi:hypothetical protein
MRTPPAARTRRRTVLLVAGVAGALLLDPRAAGGQEARQCRFAPVGLIAERARELDGERGPLGCAVGPERAVGDRGARAMAFARGEVVWSPAQGERMVVAAYQQANNIVVSWGDTRPNSYTKFLVRWRRGALEGQRDVTEYVSGNRGFFTLRKPVPGVYDVIVKGCRGTTCAPEWTHPARVRYEPPPPPTYERCARGLQPRGLIGAKWAEKGGAEGPFGCPVGPESPVPGRNGAIQQFENGDIAFSPDQGDGLTVLLFRETATKLVFEWDDTSPHAHDEILLRLEKDGAEVTQRSLPPDRSHGWAWGEAPGPGHYRVMIEGRKDRRSPTGWTIPVSVGGPRPGGGISMVQGAPRPECDVQGDERIRRHWRERVGGPRGAMGCPRGAPAPYPGRNGHVVDFANGQIVWSPDHGEDLTIAAWQVGGSIQLDWGATATFRPDRVLVRGVYEGLEIGQDEIRDSPRVTGYTLKREPDAQTGDDEERHLVTRRGAGRYAVVIKGCDDRCQPSWTIPVTVDFRTPAELPFDASLVTPRTGQEAMGGRAARGRAALLAVAGQPRALEGKHGRDVGDDETIQMIAMLELVAQERRAGRSGRGLRRHARAFDYLDEIDNAFRTATVYAVTGTSCDEPGFTRTGEYDTALKGYIPILYRYEALLAPDVRFRLRYLLSKTGPHDPADGSAGRCKHRETENHVWMIESSRYLANQLWARWTGDPKYDNGRNGMRGFIFARLTSHLDRDFEEYNSRPYARYTWAAIQNLYDFAEDAVIKSAAQSVLDYWSARAAVFTNDGRAQPPFRRLSGNHGQDAYAAAGDRLKKQLLVYTAPTLSMAELTPANGIEALGPSQMATAAATTYQPPALVLDLLVNHDHRAFYQIVRHEATEVYASERDFLITGGGTPAPASIAVLGFTRRQDRGVAQRTALVPTGTLSATEQFIRFDGRPADDERHSGIGVCVAPGFACGRNPVVPPRYRQPGCATTSGPWTFVDFSSPACRRGRATEFGFYAAVFGAGTAWGFLEAVPRAQLGGLSLAEFAAGTLARNRGGAFDANAENRYVDFGGAAIRFDLRSSVPIRATGRPALDRELQRRAPWVMAFGSVINSGSREAADRWLTITNAATREELVIRWNGTTLTRTLRPAGATAVAIGRGPPPAGPPAPPPARTPAARPVRLAALPDGAARLAALRAVNVDETVDNPAGLRQWMTNPTYTPYPAIGQALLDLLGGRRLRQAVSIDVIVYNYEHGAGATSPRRVEDVDASRLRRAVLEGYNNRYGGRTRSFDELVVAASAR